MISQVHSLYTTILLWFFVERAQDVVGFLALMEFYLCIHQTETAAGRHYCGQKLAQILFLAGATVFFFPRSQVRIFTTGLDPE